MKPWVWVYGALLRKRRLIRSLTWLLVGMGVGALLLAFVSAGEIYDYQDSVDGVHLPPVDAIVCLAGGRGRITAAGDIWYRYWETTQFPVPVPVQVGRTPAPSTPPILYISGMGRTSNWGVFKKQIHSGVFQVVRQENVVLETESANTEENARYLLDYGRKRGWKRILLMTSPYHMRRAKLIFERTAGLEKPIGIETLSVHQEPFEAGEWNSSFHGIRVTMLEYLKWVWYQQFWKTHNS